MSPQRNKDSRKSIRADEESNAKWKTGIIERAKDMFSKGRVNLMDLVYGMEAMRTKEENESDSDEGFFRIKNRDKKSVSVFLSLLFENTLFGFKKKKITILCVVVINSILKLFFAINCLNYVDMYLFFFVTKC